MSSIVERIAKRLFADLFEVALIDNNLRGLWAEYMVADILGPECGVVGGGWYSWDLQIGDDERRVPERIRIQVKNSARTQPWNKVHKTKYSTVEWFASTRRRPEYIPAIPCEAYGFLCDLFILCAHIEEDWEIADHRNPEQWRFYIVRPSDIAARYPACLIESEKRRWWRITPRMLADGLTPGLEIKPLTSTTLTLSAVRGALSPSA